VKQIWCQNNNLIKKNKKTMPVLLHFNNFRPVVMPRIVFNNTETAYTSKLRFLKKT
jgi:hypothetical protein